MNQYFSKCRECPFFKQVKGRNYGTCYISKSNVKIENDCEYTEFGKDLDLNQAIKVLHYHQKWRRGCKIQMVSPSLTGMAIDVALQTMRKVQTIKSKNK